MGKSSSRLGEQNEVSRSYLAPILAKLQQQAGLHTKMLTGRQVGARLQVRGEEGERAGESSPTRRGG